MSELRRGGRPWWMTSEGRRAPGDVFQDWSMEAVSGQRSGLANVDLWEEDGSYVLKVELPGFGPEEVDVRVQPSSVSFAARREEGEERLGRSYLLQESRRGSASRTVALPREVDPDATVARFQNGVLTVVLPIRDEAGRRRIDVH